MKIVPHYPEGEAGMRVLAERIATVQASYVCNQMKKLNCPREQKLELLQAILTSSHEIQRQKSASQRNIVWENGK